MIEGDSLVFSVVATAPELEQSTTFTLIDGGLSGVDCVVAPGGPGVAATASCLLNPTQAQVGPHTLIFRATDDGMPSLSTDLEICINVIANPNQAPLCNAGGPYASDCQGIAAAILLDGAGVSLGQQRLGEIEPDEVRIGMRVEVEWAAAGAANPIQHWGPNGEPDVPHDQLGEHII